MNKVDAALEWKSGKIYLFGGGEYVRLDPLTGVADAGYPRPIAGGWPGVFERDIDAAVLWNNGKAYFFKGDSYVRYDVAADRADPGYPKKIAGAWPGVFDSDIDAAITWTNGKAYFFKGSEYVRFDVATNRADAGYPKPIAGSWPGLFVSAIDDAAHWGPGTVVFLSGRRFVLYDIAQDRARPPEDVPQAWFGTTAEPEPGVPVEPSTPTEVPASGLSERRRYIVEDLLPGVVPSVYGQQRFTKLTFGLTKDNPSVTPGYTTCGSLPMYVARMLEDTAIGGTNGLRSSGLKKGAWVDADGSRRPLPGDLYALLNKGETNRLNGGIAHVGVIVDASGEQWKTADAGQGDGWAADYVTRAYDPDAGTLSGEVVKTGNERPPRVLAGWIDVDVYPFPKP